MTAHIRRDDALAENGDLVQRLVRAWRVRCAIRRAQWELTSGPAATELCRETVRTLRSGDAAPGLHDSLRNWGAAVPSAPEARAALQCLADAVWDLAAVEFGDFRPRGLDPVLEQLAAESALAPAERRRVSHPDPLAGCAGRGALERDLATLVARASHAGEDLTVAVLALDGSGSTKFRRRSGTDMSQMGALLATVRSAFGTEFTVYRAAGRELAVVVPGTGPLAVGEHILSATCRIGPSFVWGRANLRRTDFSGANRALVVRRNLSVGGAVAASMLLVAGVGLAVAGSPVASPTTHVAEAAPPAPARPSPASAAPELPETVTPAQVPLSGSSAAPSTPGSTSTSGAALVSYQAPTPPAATGPSPPPPPPPAPSPAPPGPPAHGHSANAPGHLKAPHAGAHQA